jgi:hypothetical protein
MRIKQFILPFILIASLLLLAACGDYETIDQTPTLTATATPRLTPSATPTVQPSPTATAPAPNGDVPSTPTALEIEGEFSDLSATIPPGQGELGRITVSWQDNSADEDGFRIYEDCGEAVSVLVEVPEDTTSQGPLGSCRPGRIGVAAFNESGTSPIIWSSEEAG